tara:strand:+ start:8764 stop:9651 length:888 start_codon:yes stop_codon:yes gene_type:complete
MLLCAHAQGVQSCQIATDGAPGEVRLHCSKRSSAALRTAIAFESEMKRRCVEAQPVERSQLTSLTAPRRASGVESGIAARVRRDAKNALEQRVTAVSCGEHPMFTVPVVGRAIRMYKQWFALCSYCATLTKVQPGITVYGSEICCLRCDHAMLGVDDLSAGPLITQSSGKVCRYCGHTERINTTGARWKELKAPLDIAGPNALLPPPLRRVCLRTRNISILRRLSHDCLCTQVWYCPTHYKPWLLNAHRVMETRVILAHIAHNAKPVFGVESSEQDAQETPVPVKKKQRKLPKKK